MNGEELKTLQTEFAKLETIVEERWKSHAQRAEDLKQWLQNNFNDIFSKLDNLNCKEHRAQFKTMWTILSLILAGMLGRFWWLMTQ